MMAPLREYTPPQSRLGAWDEWLSKFMPAPSLGKPDWLPKTGQEWLELGDRTIGGAFKFKGDIPQPPPDDPGISTAHNLWDQIPVYLMQTAPQTLGKGLRETWDSYVTKPAYDFLFRPMGEVDKEHGRTPDVTGQPAVNYWDDVQTDSISSAGPEQSFEGGTKYIPKPPPTVDPFKIDLPPELKPTILAQPPEVVPALLPDAPQETPFDYGPMLKKMDEYQPQDLDRGQYMKDRILSNLSRALAAGASGSGHSGMGGALARFGAGFGTAQADTTDRFLGEQKDIDEAQRIFGLKKLDIEMGAAKEAHGIDFANKERQYQTTTQNIQEQNRATQSNAERRYQTDSQNAQATNEAANTNATNNYNVLMKNAEIMHQTNQTNADRMYDYENEKGRLLETQVTPGKKAGTFIIQETNPDGKITYKYKDMTDPYNGGIYTDEQLDTFKKLRENGLGNTQQYKVARYLPLLQSRDFTAVKKEILKEAVETNQLAPLLESGLIDQDAFEKTQGEVMAGLQQRGIDASTEAGKEAFMEALAGTLVFQIDLDNPQLLEQLAGTGNYGARLIITKSIQKRAATAPAGAGIGAR